MLEKAGGRMPVATGGRMPVPTGGLNPVIERSTAGGAHRCVSLSPRCISLDLHNFGRTYTVEALTEESLNSSLRVAFPSTCTSSTFSTPRNPSPPVSPPRTPWQGRTYTVEELTEESFKGVDIALFSAGGSIRYAAALPASALRSPLAALPSHSPLAAFPFVRAPSHSPGPFPSCPSPPPPPPPPSPFFRPRSKKFGPAAVAEGTIVVDNSSAFRMTDGVPLVVPERQEKRIGRGGQQFRLRMTDGVPLVVPEASESRLRCVDGARNAK
ncbi:unnamed protein product [Closterium sp. NIES-54]